MAGQNRYLRGPISETFVEVRANVVVEPGDFMFQFATAGDLGAGVAADNRAYPFTYAKATTGSSYPKETIYNDFLGVAMQGSLSGTTENISIATDGIFKYPMYALGAVTVGSSISAVSINPDASAQEGVSKQTVFTGTAKPGSTAYLGICMNLCENPIRSKFR